MKRMQLIAAALCLIMITTVGAGAVAAKQEVNPRQAGSSSIYFYDVAATDGHGKGKLQIDTKQQTFLFNGQDFTPSQTFMLLAGSESGGTYLFASGASTAAGTVHITGKWSVTGAAQPGLAGFHVGLLLPGKSTPYSGTITRGGSTDKDYNLVFTDEYGQTFTFYLDPNEITPSGLPATISATLTQAIFVNDIYTVTFVYNGVAYTAPYYTSTLNSYYTYQAWYNHHVIGGDAIFGTVWLNSWDATQHKNVQTGAQGVSVQVLYRDPLLGWIGYNTGTTDSNGRFCVKGPSEDLPNYKVQFTLGAWSVTTNGLSSSKERSSYC